MKIDVWKDFCMFRQRIYYNFILAYLTASITCVFIALRQLIFIFTVPEEFHTSVIFQNDWIFLYFTYKLVILNKNKFVCFPLRPYFYIFKLKEVKLQLILLQAVIIFLLFEISLKIFSVLYLKFLHKNKSLFLTLSILEKDLLNFLVRN